MKTCGWLIYSMSMKEDLWYLWYCFHPIPSFRRIISNTTQPQGITAVSSLPCPTPWCFKGWVLFTSPPSATWITRGQHHEPEPMPSIVWYIYIHLAWIHGKCRKIYHAWIVWGNLLITWSAENFLFRTGHIFCGTLRGKHEVDKETSNILQPETQEMPKPTKGAIWLALEASKLPPVWSEKVGRNG